MACVDQYVRLENVRELIKTALRNKGVTVPDNTKYEGIPPLIDSIPEPKYQAKSVTPSNSQQIIKPDGGYDALSQVTVGAAPLSMGYITSITTDSSSNSHTFTFSKSVKGMNVVVMPQFMITTFTNANSFGTPGVDSLSMASTTPAIIRITSNGSVQVGLFHNLNSTIHLIPANFTGTLNSAGTAVTITATSDFYYRSDYPNFKFIWMAI